MRRTPLGYGVSAPPLRIAIMYSRGIFSKNFNEIHVFTFLTINEILVEIIKGHNQEVPFLQPVPYLTIKLSEHKFRTLVSLTNNELCLQKIPALFRVFGGHFL